MDSIIRNTADIWYPTVSPDGKGWLLDSSIPLGQDFIGFDCPAIQYQTSSAHTFGNVLACVERYFLRYFPDEIWNEIYVSTQIGHRQIKSVNDRYKKRKRPFMALKPRIEWNDSNRFLQGTLLTERFNEVVPTFGWGSLFNMFVDPKNAYRVQYKMNRHVIYIDFVLSFDTMIEQINFMNALLNTHFTHPFDIETPLETQIPRGILHIMSKASGIPIYDNDGSVYTFMGYLNSIAVDPITYKLKSASSNDEFFRYYFAIIRCQMENVSADEGEQDGMVRRNFNISFTFRCEFTGTGFLYIQHRRIQEYKNETPKDDRIPNAIGVPLFSDIWHREDFNLSPGWQIVSAPTFHRNLYAKDIDSTVEFADILSPSFFQVYAHHIMHNIPIDLFLNIKIRRMGDIILEGRDYIIDWKKLTITLIDDVQKYGHLTYKILFIMNFTYMNQILAELVDANFTYDREEFNKKINRSG